MGDITKQLYGPLKNTIFKLRNIIAALETQKANAARDREEKPQQQRSHPFVPVLPTRVVIDSIPPLSHEEKTYRTEKSTREREKHFIDKVTIWILVAYVLFTGGQTLLTRQAIENNREAFEKTLRQMEDASDDNAISVGETLIQMKSQTRAQQQAARAAINSIQITKASLRAAISLSPKPDWPHKMVNLAIDNTGRITSGPIEIIVHFATVSMPIPFGQVNLGNAVDRHWKRYYFPSSAVGTPYGIAVPFPKMVETQLMDGTQSLIMAAYVIYNDGFTEDGNQTESFCTHTMVQIVAKELFMSPCDGKEIIPKMEHLDGYPNNEDQY